MELDAYIMFRMASLSKAIFTGLEAAEAIYAFHACLVPLK